jgi:hypothetical protein
VNDDKWRGSNLLHLFMWNRAVTNNNWEEVTTIWRNSSVVYINIDSETILPYIEQWKQEYPELFL